MTAYDIRLCSLDLHILLAGALSAFDPFQSLARCHVEISLQKIFILFLRDPCSLQVTRAMAKLVFPDCSVNSLACGQSVFCLVDLACCIDLFCATPCAMVPVGAMVSLQRSAIKRISKEVISAPARIPIAYPAPVLNGGYHILCLENPGLFGL